MTRRLLGALLIALLTKDASAQSDSGVTTWLRSKAVLIDSAGQSFRALDPAIASARLIGVGESVHGIQQFMAFRFELLEDLVRRHQVTALILESGLPEAIAVDDYVQGRRDTIDYASALGGEYSDSEVMRGVVHWLREWNRGPGRAHPVAVYGADISIGDGRSMLPALDRLITVAGGDAQIRSLADSIRPIATRLSAPWWGGALQNYNAVAPETKALLTGLIDRLVLAAGQWTGDTADQRSWAERFALLMQQDEVMLRRGPMATENPRDAAMASNTRWLVDRLPSGERAVLWAHNAHVQRTLIKGPAIAGGSRPSMGHRLGADLGSGYLAIGTSYGGASMDSSLAPAVGSVDATLAAVSHSAPFMVLLRGALPPEDVRAWLTRDRPTRFQVGYLTVPLADAFDAVVYFERASPMVKARSF